VNVTSRLIGLMGLCFTALLASTPLSLASVHTGDSLGRLDGATHLGKEIAFHVTDQLSAQTQAAVFPSRDVAFSLTHRLWARAPGEEGKATRQEFAWLRLSQPLNLSGQQPHAFRRLAPTPLWADLHLEARVAPFSGLHLSTTAAYDPAEARLEWTTAEFSLQPLTCWTLSLAPAFGNGSQLELLDGGMQLALPGAWTVSYAMRYQLRDAAVVSQMVTTRYRSSYGNVRLQLAQSPEEMRVGVLIDLVSFLRRTLGF
jgi:hypothetical protein